MSTVGQNRVYTLYMTVNMVLSLPKIPYTHRIYMVLANPINVKHTYTHRKAKLVLYTRIWYAKLQRQCQLLCEQALSCVNVHSPVWTYTPLYEQTLSCVNVHSPVWKKTPLCEQTLSCVNVHTPVWTNTPLCKRALPCVNTPPCKRALPRVNVHSPVWTNTPLCEHSPVWTNTLLRTKNEDMVMRIAGHDIHHTHTHTHTHTHHTRTHTHTHTHTQVLHNVSVSAHLVRMQWVSPSTLLWTSRMQDRCTRCSNYTIFCLTHISPYTHAYTKHYRKSRACRTAVRAAAAGPVPAGPVAVCAAVWRYAIHWCVVGFPNWV